MLKILIAGFPVLFFLGLSAWAQTPVLRELTSRDHGISLDLRYATTNNFTGIVLYPCPRCYLHPRVADALLRAAKDFQKQGYRILLFDCYRPVSVQQRLWEKVPDARFVTPPEKGSMHNRGAAIDITLIDLKSGKPLDMGTPYDFFGREAYMDFNGLSKLAASNRTILHSTLKRYGFRGIRTEWWHFSFIGAGATVLDWTWTCL